MSAYNHILFNRPNGSNFYQKLFEPNASDAANNREANVKNASIMTVAYIPTIGDCIADTRYGIGSSTKVSPFNADLSLLYIKLKGKAMTLGNYDAADVGKAMLALDSLYGLLAELDVDITALSEYCYDNAATRGMIQEILWNNPSVAAANMANIIKRRNNIAAKMKILPFIPGIPFLQDHVDWARFIYKDDNLDKSSLIIFRRAAYYRWCCRTTDTYPGSLVLSDNTTGSGYSNLNHTIIKAEDKFNILEMLLHDYSLDQDFIDLCAGIANAYGIDTDLYHLPTFPDDLSKFRLEMKFDLDVIDSLRSADFYQLKENYGSIKGIDEDNEGHLKYTQGFGANPDGKFNVPFVVYNTTDSQFKCPDTGDGRIVFSYEDRPTPESVDVIARYVHDYVHENLSDGNAQVFGLKTEFLTGISVWYQNTLNQFVHVDMDQFIVAGLPNSNIFGSREAELMCCSFNSFPHCYGLIVDGNGVYMGNRPINTVKDIDNIGFIPRYANSSCSEEFMWSKFFGASQSNYNNKKRRSKKTSDPKSDEEQPK